MSHMPQRPQDPWVWIDPNLLQLVGLGTKADPYLADGRHLRWFFGRMLGFPRSGFILRRRRSPFGDLKTLRPLLPFMGKQSTTESALGTGARVHFDSGITISKTDGFTFKAVPRSWQRSQFGDQ